MKRLAGFLSVLAATTCLAGPGTAASIYELRATSIGPEPNPPWSYWFSDFSVIYSDDDGDLLLSLDEMLSFSGVTWLFHDDDEDPVFYDLLTGLGTAPGFTDGPDHQHIPGWWFGRTTSPFGVIALPYKWTYDRVLVREDPVAPVPLPATAGLLAAALIAMRLRRRG